MLSLAALAGEPSFDQKWVPLPSEGGENTAKLCVPPCWSTALAPRSSDTDTSAAAGPIRPSEAASNAGCVSQVIVDSDQLSSVTAWTSPPSPSEDGAVL